jgi:putative hydrolase of the HAD superfamily
MARPVLKAVFFDIDDTLYSTTSFAAQARANSVDALIRYGLKAPREGILRELEEVISEFSSNYEHHFEKLLLRLPARCYRGINRGILVAAAIVAYHQTKFAQLAPYPDVIDALRVLAKTRLIRGIITAGLEIKQAEKIVRLNIYEFLTPRAIFISDQIGISKPNVKLYQRACEGVGVKPSEAMYVGDSPLSDVDPPNRIGMITVLNRRTGKYANVQGRTAPRHEIHDFHELLGLLKEQYNVPIAGGR